MKRKHIKVFGMVQGVGFRYYTQKLARKYHIVGTVENVDNYVDIYAQGDEQSLTQFINAVTEGASPASHVEDFTTEEIEIEQSLKDFKTI
ncbi:acylphosphatase [Staphylococcus pseudoxylosus]|uniref:acylphosphatase n=1 Tax=Staphylococcus pseudoxylosus TaxID=2282419 RepID=A0AAQ0MGF2_9STAP|nr:acylphosphatase [Staphylococcus pseudoxylosus]PTI81051.1 acylphosphatase [Staphylococcus xylosus]MBM2658654.1 acylphosphatase [Staphylococcus pseudoxylosus]MCE5002118.1 acylphosphatase [Staphylococcus pseudoxylosus]MDW8546741.1 acylphosphatase [Staphylococcus pseudoxylosus]MEB5783662.1 acylphosphatase [Staphylococcus pseudoxylosus]